jgi:hypothetical protein
MPTLKDLAADTSRLDQLATALHTELTAGSIDFRKMVGLADDIAQHSDRLATAFNTMADALDQSLADAGAAEAGANGSGGNGAADASRADVSRARKA